MGQVNDSNGYDKSEAKNSQFLRVFVTSSFCRFLKKEPQSW